MDANLQQGRTFTAIQVLIRSDRCLLVCILMQFFIRVASCEGRWQVVLIKLVAKLLCVVYKRVVVDKIFSTDTELVLECKRMQGPVN